MDIEGIDRYAREELDDHYAKQAIFDLINALKKEQFTVREFDKGNEALSTEIIALRERAETLLEVLRMLEYDNNGECPLCGRPIADSHARDCKLAAALKGRDALKADVERLKMESSQHREEAAAWKKCVEDTSKDYESRLTSLSAAARSHGLSMLYGVNAGLDPDWPGGMEEFVKFMKPKVMYAIKALESALAAGEGKDASK